MQKKLFYQFSEKKKLHMHELKNDFFLNCLKCQCRNLLKVTQTYKLAFKSSTFVIQVKRCGKKFQQRKILIYYLCVRTFSMFPTTVWVINIPTDRVATTCTRESSSPRCIHNRVAVWPFKILEAVLVAQTNPSSAAISSLGPGTDVRMFFCTVSVVPFQICCQQEAVFCISVWWIAPVCEG